MPESFAPGVMIHGTRVTPPGWVWVLGFALGGCEWAIREADTKEFKEIIRTYYGDQSRREAEAEVARLEQRLRELRAKLEGS